jgi:hypothetical protein
MSAPAPARDGRRAERMLDAATDAAIVALGAWTVCFTVARALHLRADPTTTLWLAVVAVALYGLWRLRPGVDEVDGTDETAYEPVARPVLRDRRILAGAAAVLLAAAIAVGRSPLDEPGWWAFAVPTVVALVAVAVVALRQPVVRVPVARDDDRVRAGVLVVLVVASLFAVLAAVTIRSDEDDVYLVNRSAWVEATGRFPVRDVLFSDQVFAVTRQDRMETAFEPLVGAVARWLPWSAPTVTYLVVAPAVSFLSVAALWRLLRALRSPVPAVATVVAATYVAFDAIVHTAYGNFSFGRAWQGKTLLVALVLPLIWRHGLVWGRDGDRRAGVLLVVANVAAVGLSTTAPFTAPVVSVLAAGAGYLGGDRRERARRLGVAGVAAAVPLLAGIVAVAAPRQSPSPAALLLAAGPRLGHLVTGIGHPPPLGGTAGLSPPDPWYTVVGTGMIAVVTALAIVGGWIGTRDRASRLALVAAPIVLVGGFLAPGVLRGLDHVAGSGGILWRVMWVIPAPAMVGLVGTAGWLPRRGRAGSALGPALAAAIVVAVTAGGLPVWSESNGATVGRPAWDVDSRPLAAARRLVALAPPGTTVAAPTEVGGAVAIVSARVHAVNPRDRYLSGRWAVRAFRAGDRRLLSRAVTIGDTPDDAAGAIDRALRRLRVGAACVRPRLAGGVAESVLESRGFRFAGADGECRYWEGSRDA